MSACCRPPESGLHVTAYFQFAALAVYDKDKFALACDFSVMVGPNSQTKFLSILLRDERQIRRTRRIRESLFDG